MCNPNNGTKLSLKVVINKQKSKVLFAEANSYVADALFRFLTLPLGKIVQILDKHYGTTEAPIIGCLTTLCRNLFTNKYFSLGNDEQLRYLGSKSLEVEYLKAAVEYDNTLSTSSVDYRRLALTTTATTFVISDDLRVVPMGSTGFLQALTNLGISDFSGAERSSFTFEIVHVVDLLMLSLISSTPLTDLVLKHSNISSIVAKPKQVYQPISELNTDVKMSLIVSIQKSTNKLLFAEAREDFVAFLFSVLTLTLGEVVRCLDGETPFKNIDNLYSSVVDFIGDEYFVDQDAKRKLINPNIIRGYFSSDRIVKNEGKKHKMFILNDDLTLAPFSMASVVLILNDLGIPLSDVKEMEFHIGMEEALMILEASLISKTALTDALINPMLSRPTWPEIVKPTASSNFLRRKPQPIKGGGAFNLLKPQPIKGGGESFVAKAEE